MRERWVGRFDVCIPACVVGAGTPEMKDCCHGGCDNCDYSRVFDEMNAGKAKWISCYLDREHIDGRRHEAPMLRVFGDDGSLSVDDFVQRLEAMPPVPAMGAKMADVNSEFDADGVAAVFLALSGGAESLDRTVFAAKLQELTGEEHGVAWRPFLNALVK